MRKIHLKIESLAVESFATEAANAGQGTVHAHVTDGAFCQSADDQVTCARRRSDYASCYVDCECTNRYVKCLNPDTA